MDLNTTSAILQLLDPLKQLEEKIKSIELILNSCSTSQRRLLEMIENSLMDSANELESEIKKLLKLELDVTKKAKEWSEVKPSEKQTQIPNEDFRVLPKTERAKEIIIERLKNNKELEWNEIVNYGKSEGISAATMRKARELLRRDGYIEAAFQGNEGQAKGVKCFWFLMNKAQEENEEKNEHQNS